MPRRPLTTHRTRAMLLCFALLGVLGGCTSTQAPTVLTVLASSELADMQPVLDQLRRDTGVELRLDYQGTLDASNTLVSGTDHHDLAWLSTDRYYLLKLKNSGHTGPAPLTTRTMLSPVVLAAKPAAAQRLRTGSRNGHVTWADVADNAADGQLHFAMTDPRHSGSGLAALIGVATAAAGTGNALQPEDVTCDRLRGLFAGRGLTANDSNRLLADFVTHQDDLDAMINYESVLLTLNASGKLREPLQIIYPQDGIVLSDYPLLLLDPAKRSAYDKVTGWLKTGPAQQKIMDSTLRRPLDPGVTRDDRLREPIGNALYFPDKQEVFDKLLADYDAQSTPGDVIFVLDFSGSMRGSRTDALRSTFAGFSGADTSSSGKFARFYRGERFALIRFAAQIEGERTFTINGQNDLDAMRGFLSVSDFGEHTAVWSALDHAYQVGAELQRSSPGRSVSIVLMTDGENNAGITVDDFLTRYTALPPDTRAIHTYTIHFGEADASELNRVAAATGGRMVDANATSLLDAFKEIRGCR